MPGWYRMKAHRSIGIKSGAGQPDGTSSGGSAMSKTSLSCSGCRTARHHSATAVDAHCLCIVFLVYCSCTVITLWLVGNLDLPALQVVLRFQASCLR